MKVFLGKLISGIIRVIRKYRLPFLAGIAFAVLCFIGINAAMGPASRPEFCGSQ